MKAFVAPRYGSPDVLELKDVDAPSPGDNQILVKVRAASINAYDSHMLRGEPVLARLMMGLRKSPDSRPGADIAGTVEAVGKDVTRFRPGDDVFGDIGKGGFAEYACAKESLFALKPARISFEEAAATTMAAITALQGLRDKGQIKAGQTVVIDGAGGGVGTFAVQIARYFGAEVTAVCGSHNQEVARSIGADHVIDYTREDFTKNGRRYDLIFAANGHHSVMAYLRALNAGGTFVLAGGSMALIAQLALMARMISRLGSKKALFYMARLNIEDMDCLKTLLESGAVKPVIDRRYRFVEIPEAIRYLEQGHARGKIVITVA
ncbi:MAG: NAD(P)-dependent alcohol dehydrogenase [Thermoflexales bacterium]